MSDPDRVADLLLAFRDEGLHLTEMSVQQPTLDEVFLALTGKGIPDADAEAHDPGAAEAPAETTHAGVRA
jgi:ABC-2 type transport system ATP-binding protein